METVQKQAVRKATVKMLSKYTSVQLLTKLETGILLNLSREVALEILEKRKIDVSKFKDSTESVSNDLIQEKALKKEKISKVKVEESVSIKEKIKQVKTARENKKPFELIDVNDSKVVSLLEDKEISKTEKIKQLLILGYSVTQISKRYFPQLNAHYSHVHTVYQNQKK